MLCKEIRDQNLCNTHLRTGQKCGVFDSAFFFRWEFFAFPTSLDLLSWQFFAMWWKSQFFTTIWENMFFACAQLGQSTKSIISAIAGVWWQVLLDKSWTPWSRWEWGRSYVSISRILWSMLIEYCFGQSGANYTLRSFSNIWQEGDVRMRVYLAQRGMRIGCHTRPTLSWKVSCEWPSVSSSTLTLGRRFRQNAPERSG